MLYPVDFIPASSNKVFLVGPFGYPNEVSGISSPGLNFALLTHGISPFVSHKVLNGSLFNSLGLTDSVMVNPMR